jgi:hypothetical protein
MSVRPRHTLLRALLTGVGAPLAAEQARSRHDPASTMAHIGSTLLGTGTVYALAEGRFESTDLCSAVRAAFAETH